MFVIITGVIQCRALFLIVLKKFFLLGGKEKIIGVTEQCFLINKMHLIIWLLIIK